MAVPLRESAAAWLMSLSGYWVISLSMGKRGQGFRLSKISQAQLSTRHFPHGAWSFSEWPQVHIPSLPIL
jgi:hypothetical protein